MNATQNWTAAEVVDDWCHRHGYDLMDVYEAHSLLAALAEAGYTIAGPGQVVVDRERWERVRDAAEEMSHRITERGWGDQYTRLGDLDE